MIIGIGTDLVDIRRIERSLERFQKAFLNRIYTKLEIHSCETRGAKSQKKRASMYAMRFAAKEACAKALGTGLAQGVFWKDMQNGHLPTGKPIMTLYGGALKRLQSLIPIDMVAKIEISLTDEYPMAHAIVIISAEKKEDLK